MTYLRNKPAIMSRLMLSQLLSKNIQVSTQKLYHHIFWSFAIKFGLLFFIFSSALVDTLFSPRFFPGDLLSFFYYLLLYSIIFIPILDVPMAVIAETKHRKSWSGFWTRFFGKILAVFFLTMICAGSIAFVISTFNIRIDL